MARKRRYKKNSWKMVFGIAVIIILIGCGVYIYHHNFQNLSNDVEKQEVNKDNDSNNINAGDDAKDETNDEVNNTNNDTLTKEEEDKLKEEQNNKKTQEHEFSTQTGEEVKINANKVVTATGFAGASNYQFYLRGTTLYFRNTSNEENKEEILAHNVKDLYLENREVVAELYSDGEVILENNYITYKK